MGRGRPKKYKTEEERKAAKKEYRKQYYQKNAEKEKEMAKHWYQENGEKQREMMKYWREQHPDYGKQYYQENPDYFKEYRKTPIGRAAHLVSNYQLKDKKQNRGECTLTAQWIVDNIFNKPCHYNCGETDWTKIGCDRIDNSLPHTPDNVVPCCDECNVKRGTKTYEEFLMTLSGINKSVS